jgi:hypothetical protein
MSKLRPVFFNELVRRLKLFGFKGPHGGGKHLYMLKGDLRLTIPNPHKQEIGIRFIDEDTQTGRNNKRRVDRKRIKGWHYNFLLLRANSEKSEDAE